jgi:pyruvate formate lyase activating enzyme
MNKQSISRRDFLKRGSHCCLLLGGTGILMSNLGWLKELLASEPAALFTADFQHELLKLAPVAKYWTSTAQLDVNCLQCHDQVQEKEYDHGERIVKCLLCAQGCVLSEGERGKCRARMNIDGEMRSLVYGRPISMHIDPIEKKPFYHFLPGRDAFSLATAGCPLSCKFCQNWELSQARPEDYAVKYVPPGEIVRNSSSRDVPIIAFTYNEPTVFTEYLLDIAMLAKKQNIRSVLVSCGFMTKQPLTDMCEVLDAIKIDLKGFSEEFYRSVSSAELAPVLRSIKQVAKSKAHLEIVNLVVPTLNDSEKMLTGLSDWVMGEIGPDVPIHFTKFHPDYKMLNLTPTPVATLEKARDIAMGKGIHYAFVGNVPGHSGNNTFCPSCNRLIIKRNGFFILENHVINGNCEYCRYSISGVWS